MRLIVILSPTNKYGTKTEYTKLRKFLISDGYLRISEEVFMRVTNSRRACEKHIRRIDDFAPSTGIVRIIMMTEKSYKNIIMLTGEDDYQERTVGTNFLISL